MGAMNTSGLQPVEYKILILPELVEETDECLKSAKAAGLVLIDKTTDREKQSQVRGTLVAIGGNAFEDWHGQIPEVGMVVWFAKYAGFCVPGDDGKEYRLCNDKDVAALVIPGGDNAG